jgi:two-component system, OmpR family, phosphate regulon sensor histidine kinase PhoR
MESSLGTSTQPIPPRRRVGVRLWMTLAFAAVGIATGVSVYVFLSGSSEQSAQERSVQIAIGETFRLSEQVEQVGRRRVDEVVAASRNESFTPWVFSREGNLRTHETVLGVSLAGVPRRAAALRRALSGRGFVDRIGQSNVVVVAVPVVREGDSQGAVLARATQAPEVREALASVREDRLKALAIAVGVAVVIGALVASLVTLRIKRLARGAGQLAEGRLDIPVRTGGRDEIGDLGRALETMRTALRQSFEMLSTDRDTLSAILAALSEAVMVVGKDGEVRFSNPAAGPLIGAEGRPVDVLEPWLTRAAQQGEARSDALLVEESVYALHARELPAEDAILVVVRDRTEELRRQLAEREFVSNAAHELRNPIAGISGAIEVLRSGAKDDPEAREHFLDRLAADAERISRLTHSLLTLARIEAAGVTESDLVDVAIAAEEAVQAVVPPDGLGLSIDLEPGLSVRGDPALVRQVMIMLLTNACKHTDPGGAVTLRGRGSDHGAAVIEVTDTGTGIPPEEQERIFERFYRGGNALETEGFGLGLSIARRMVEVMGGELGVRSEVGEGSTFWFRLPVAEPARTPVA